jgi:hypothetical protein
MAILKDEEEQKGQGTSQLMGQAPQAPQAQQAGQQPQQQESQAPAMIGGTSATQSSAPVKAMPKQQKAGTGTFSNLKAYLQAAQGGGQQKVAQAATQQVQKLGAGAQKGITQAQQTFGQKMGAGSGAIFQAGQNQYLNAEQAAEQAKKSTEDIIGTARGVTYQAPQPTLTKPQDYLDRTGNLNEAGLSKLGDKASAFQEELNAIKNRMIPMDYGPGSANEQAGIQKQKDIEDLYEKYGLNVPVQTTTPQAQQYFTDVDKQRFADIINAQYQGPESLQQAGLYESAAQKARTAQEAALNAQTAGGRELLLKDIFGRGRDYSRGASKLDALLLNTSRQGLEQLQEQAKVAGGMQQQLQAAQNESAAQAQNRAAAIESIRQAARGEFTGARTAEEKAVEERLTAIEQDWNKLPEYLKGALASGTPLTQQELDLLGVQSGTGLYNLTPEQIVQTSAAERSRLISKDELTRQLALQQLAGLDVSKQLQKELPIQTNLEKAGTQTAADAVNRKAIQDLLATEEQKFMELASGQNITGEGMKKHSQTGKKFYAQETANLKDVLERAGYKFDPSMIPTTTGISGASTGQISRDDSGDLISNALEPYSGNTSLFNKAYTGAADYVTLGGTAILRGAGIDIPGAISNTVESIFGGGKRPDSYAKAIAADIARQDLQKKIAEQLQSSGFYNRALAGESEQTKARQAALASILANQEKLRG